jgi:urease accessory protein
MPTDAAGILTLAQWFSPAYPVGAFSYSHGLEQAVAAGDVTDGAALQAWIGDVLRHGSGRSDAVFLAAAFIAETPREIAEIDATCRALAATKERLMETVRQGAAFAAVTSEVLALDLPALCYPVAVGRAARLQRLPKALSAAMFLQAFVGNLVAAGQRLLPLGQTAAQALIHALKPLCRTVAGEAMHGDMDRLSTTAFLPEIAAMRHETQYSRIFRT